MNQDRLILKKPLCIEKKAEVLAAVRKHGSQLQFVSDELRNDREVVLAAVMQDAWAFEYASDELKCEMAECWAKCMEQEVKNEL